MRTEVMVARSAPPYDVTNTSGAASTTTSTTVTARLTRRARNTILSVHIAVSVALLGDVLALLAVTLMAMGVDDPVQARTYHDVMSTFSLVFGIPLSFGALFTGLALGWGTRWGILRYPWVIAKLGLILAVILVGALVIGPAEGRMLDEPLSATARDQAEGIILAGGLFDVAALLTAIGLSVFKPGRRRRPDRVRGRDTATDEKCQKEDK